jgi:hypothetical protein
MKKLDPKAKHNFDMIVAFLQAGGSPTTPFIVRFCQEWDIKQEEFTSCMASPKKDEMIDRLRSAGLI